MLLNISAFTMAGSSREAGLRVHRSPRLRRGTSVAMETDSTSVVNSNKGTASQGLHSSPAVGISWKGEWNGVDGAETKPLQNRSLWGVPGRGKLNRLEWSPTGESRGAEAQVGDLGRCGGMSCTDHVCQKPRMPPWLLCCS